MPSFDKFGLALSSVLRWDYSEFVELPRRLFSLVIIDDEEAIRRGLMQFVDWNALGFQVQACFEDGESAVEYLEETPVDVVLTDVCMATVSGLEVAEFLMKVCPATKVVIVSGYRDFEYARQAINYHVAAYLLKPVDLELLGGAFHEIKESLVTELRQDQPKVFPSRKTESSTGENSNAKPYADLIIAKAKQFMEVNYYKEISLDDVANLVFQSPVYFSRFFKEKTGMNFIDYLTEIRVRAAVELLDKHQHKIQEVGPLVGYKNAKYFTKVFKHQMGLTPTEYRHSK